MVGITIIIVLLFFNCWSQLFSHKIGDYFELRSQEGKTEKKWIILLNGLLDVELDGAMIVEEKEEELDIELPKVEVGLSECIEDEGICRSFWAEVQMVCKWNISLSLLNYLLEVDIDEVVLVLIVGEKEVEMEDKEETVK